MPSLKFKNNHISITKFDDVEISDFSFFVGVNGAGKTHILKGVKAGDIKIDNYSETEILFLCGNDFVHIDEISGSLRSSNDDYDKVWVKINNLKAQKTKIWNENKQSHPGVNKILALMKEQKKVFDELSVPDNLQQYRGQYQIYRNKVKTLYQSNNVSEETNFTVDEILKATELQGSAIHLISEQIFKQNLRKINPVQRSFGKSLSNHNIKYHQQYNQFLASYAKNFPKKTHEDTHLEFVSKHGQNPINFVNELLKSYYEKESDGNSRGFEFVNQLEGKIAPENQNVQVPLRDMVSKKYRSLNHLSSGEKVLISIALLIYEKKETNVFPKVLLLDEVDSVLHPKMMKIFQKVIREHFVTENDGVVIMTTHTPTSIITADEDSIFRVIPGAQQKKIENIDKHDGILEVSEGLFYFQDGLSLFEQAEQANKEMIVISEGQNKNFFEHLFCKLRDSDQYSWLEKVGVVGHKHISDGHLRSMYDWCRRFNQEKTIFFVWDHDYEKGDFSDGSKVFHHVLDLQTQDLSGQSKIDNIDKLKGIENVYPVDAITNYLNNGGGIEIKKNGIQFEISNKSRALKVLKELTDLDLVTEPIQ